MVDVYLQAKRGGAAAKRFFRRLLRSHGSEPRKIVTDKLRSYGVAHRELVSEAIHSTKQYENSRAEQSHEVTRVRERGMRRLKSVKQAQRFLGAHAAVSNFFNLGKLLERLKNRKETVECENPPYAEVQIRSLLDDVIPQKELIHGEIHNHIYGDVVIGDRITVGDISNSTGVAIGAGVRLNVDAGQQGIDVDGE